MMEVSTREIKRYTGLNKPVTTETVVGVTLNGEWFGSLPKGTTIASAQALVDTLNRAEAQGMDFVPCYKD